MFVLSPEEPICNIAALCSDLSRLPPLVQDLACLLSSQHTFAAIYSSAVDGILHEMVRDCEALATHVSNMYWLVCSAEDYAAREVTRLR